MVRGSRVPVDPEQDSLSRDEVNNQLDDHCCVQPERDPEFCASMYDLGDILFSDEPDLPKSIRKGQISGKIWEESTYQKYQDTDFEFLCQLGWNLLGEPRELVASVNQVVLAEKSTKKPKINKIKIHQNSHKK